jgi:stage II sporulation protein D
VQAVPSEPSDAELERTGHGRVVRVASLAAGGTVATVPLEVFVAQILAGEGEPAASDAATQSLAMVARTYLIANAGRHRVDGYDFCDTTHCQVPRRATPAARRAAAATSGLVLYYRGAPAEVFYSASCGGRSEAASDMWPAARLPYLRSVDDDVHGADESWALELTLPEIHAALRLRGIDGARLDDVRVESRTESGRVARLRLVGFGQPAAAPESVGPTARTGIAAGTGARAGIGMNTRTVTGDQFRMALGASHLRSTAFSVERVGERLRFTGRGYGHGVGLCVIGAGRRAARGDGPEAILAHYFPGVTVARLEGAADRHPGQNGPIILP